MLLFSSSARRKHPSRIVNDNSIYKEKIEYGKLRPSININHLIVAINNFLELAFYRTFCLFYDLTGKLKSKKVIMDTGPSFRTYCESTSLHGWQYIYTSTRTGWKILWIFMVLASVIVALLFVHYQTTEFRKATVVTTVDTTTAPLSEVYFPSVTICNINQVRRSFLEELGVHDNWTFVDILYREFYTGSDTDLTKEERAILESLFSTKYYVNLEQEYGHMTMMGEKNASKVLPQEYEQWENYLNKYRDLIVTGTHFTTFAVQQPAGTMILRARYGEQTKSGQHSEFNPYFGTDVGICSIIKPQLNFNETLEDLGYWDKLFMKNHYVKPGSEVGKANGLTVLLDAETFDYTYHLRAGEGFKLSVHNHLDQPIMSIKEIDISVGSESQVAVATTLTTTTHDAQNRFNPEQRGCYFEGELFLKYLPKQFYRYEMSNCLFESAYEETLRVCNCVPSFHQVAMNEASWLRICTGTKLKCMKKIFHGIGNYKMVDTNFNLSSVLMNGTAKDSSDGRKQCLAACKDQLNLVTETSSSFPNSQTFHRREEFCLILHKLSKTCASVKAAALTDTYPTLCEYIALMPQKSDYKDICPKGVWNPEVDHPELFKATNLSFETPNGVAIALQEDVFQYAKENMALVNVYIKDPVVTRIKRDQKIPIISFVANTGGLLGLCMGFSLISAFEVIFHVLISIKRMYLFIYGHCTRSLDTIWKYKNIVRHNSTIPPPSGVGALGHAQTSNDGERMELNSVASVTSVATKTFDNSSVIMTPYLCKNSFDKQNIQIKLQNSTCESGMAIDQAVSENQDGYIDTKEGSVITQDSNLIGSTSAFDRLVNHNNTELPIKNIRSFLSLKAKRNEHYNSINTKPAFLKHNDSFKKSQTLYCPNHKTYKEVFNNKSSLDGASSNTGTNRVCKTVSPRKINIILPPRAHSETSSVNSSRESVARIQSIALQNENLSFHYDLENFSHIDETDNEEEEVL